MIQNFDYFGNIRNKIKILCNPDGTELFTLGMAKDVNYTIRYNSMSEMSFEIPYKINNKLIECYDSIRTKKLVEVEDIGVFIITNVNEVGDGVKKYKKVSCHSFEYILGGITLTILDGTYNFWNPLNPTGTLMAEVMSYLPNWTLGDVHSDLWSVYRTFDVKTDNVYSFIKSDVESAYQCVFEFDTFNRTINVKTTQSAIKKTDIFLSYNNVVKSLELEESEDELITSLSIFGGGDLDVRSVNPLGTSTIYNFDYFLNKEWMNESLMNAVKTWQDKVRTRQAEYSNLLTNLKNYNSQLIVLESQLTGLQDNLKAYELTQSVMIEGNQTNTGAYAQLLTNISNSRTQIKNKNTEIDAKKVQISNTRTTLATINTDLSMNNNFTLEQQKELSNYIYTASHIDEHFIITSTMTDVEVQEVQQELYEYGYEMLDKLSQPRYKFSSSTANILELKEFRSFAQQLEVGCELTVDMDNGLYSYPILLELQMAEGNPSSFKMVFGNTIRSDSNDYTYAELFGQTIKTSNSVKIDSPKWSEWTKSGASEEWQEFKNSVLDASKKEIVNSSNQDFVMDETGLRGRKFNSTTGQYSPEQIWFINNLLCFTNDNWQTVKQALGKIKLPNGQTMYGLVAEAIIGNLIIGNQLLIENNNKTFMVDGEGAKLTNASFTLTTKDGKGRIILDPDNGIKIQGLTNGVFKDKFYVDNNGNAIFSGDIEGSTINGSTIYVGDKNSGNYISLVPNNPLDVYQSNKKQVEIWTDSSMGGYFVANRPDGQTAFRVQGRGNNFNGFQMQAGDLQGSTAEFWSTNFDFVGVGTYSDFNVKADGFFQGDLSCSGAKPATVPTEHYGWRRLYAEESDKLYFNTKGIAKTINNKFIIRLDDIFCETIEPNSKYRYIPTITPMSDARVWVDKVYDKYIIIKSDNECEFSYNIQCIRKYYGETYLEERNIRAERMAMKSDAISK